MPYIESIGIIQGVRTPKGETPPQYIARVSVERAETICIGDVLPHFEGKQYRTMGTMALIDGSDGEWKPNHRGVDVRLVEVVVLPLVPGISGTSSHQNREKSAKKARERRAEKRKTNPPKEQLALPKKRGA